LHVRVQSDSFLYLLGFVVDEVAVLHQLANTLFSNSIAASPRRRGHRGSPRIF
jgi:hypothetical protein